MCSPRFQHPYSSDSISSSSEAGEKRFHDESSLEESEVVDELIQILVECLKKPDIKTQEILLRKCFVEIEKEIPLERFLVERIKHSKLYFLLESLEKIRPGFSQDIDSKTREEIITREVDVLSSSVSHHQAKNLKRLERFKIKTIRVGEVVKEEAATYHD